MLTQQAGKRPTGDTRQQVLDTALTLFTERGYFNTSVHDIARASKVSIGSIYHHFQDKEGIARALYRGLMERMEHELAAISEGHASAHDRCRAIVALLFELAEREPQTMAFMLYAKHREFLPNERPVCSSKPFETMRAIVAEGIRHGEICDTDPVVAATCLFGGPIRMITMRLDRILPEPLPHYLDAVWHCAWRAVAR
ncbi:MAG: TetR/AcrR family transcriptional regulator [Pseudomonadota bacterium]